MHANDKIIFRLVSALYIFVFLAAGSAFAATDYSSGSLENTSGQYNPGMNTGASSATGRVQIAADNQGIKRFFVNGRQYTPLCVNYLVEGMNPYKSFDMFDTKTFDINSINKNMQMISSAGFNCVRVWLKGYDTDDGFASVKNGPFDKSVFEQYIKNIDDTIRAANANNLRVILTGAFPGPKATPQNTHELYMPLNYLPPASSIPDTDAVDGFNRIILIPDMTKALARFYSDLMTELVRIDPRVSEELFYIDLYNEMRYDLVSPPFSRTSGIFVYEGKDYDLGDARSRQALMDAATVEFLRILGGAVKKVVPGLLVTASSGFNTATGINGFDGGFSNNKKIQNMMLRPYAELAGGSDIIDIHAYPGPAVPQYNMPPSHQRVWGGFASDEIVRPGFPASPASVSARNAPLIAGEFGAGLQSWGVVAHPPSPYGAPDAAYQQDYMEALPKALAEMKEYEKVLCDFGFSGLDIWDLGNNTNAPESTFALFSPYDSNYSYVRAFGPKYNRNFCGIAVY